MENMKDPNIALNFDFKECLKHKKIKKKFFSKSRQTNFNFQKFKNYSKIIEIMKIYVISHLILVKSRCFSKYFSYRWRSDRPY